MKRRELITLLGGTVAAWPLMTRAQQVKVWRIGMLETIPTEPNAANLAALRQGLRELGYIEGQNYVLEYQSADGQAERFPSLAAELVRARVDLRNTGRACGQRSDLDNSHRHGGGWRSARGRREPRASGRKRDRAERLHH